MEPKNLAATMLRLFLADLIVCRLDFEEEDVTFWALLHDEVGAPDVCREIMAYRKAKVRLVESRAGNPQNVVAVLLYNISHSGTRDQAAKDAWERKLAGGFSLRSVSRLDQAMDLIEEIRGSSLSERQIGQLVGRVVNLDRVTQLIKEEYNTLLGGEADGR